MNDRPSSSSPGDAGIAPAPAAAEGWGAMLQDSNGPAGPDTIQHHDQSPFVTHNSNRNNGSSQYHHHHHHHHHQNNLLYHHHQQPPHFMKGFCISSFMLIITNRAGLVIINACYKWMHRKKEKKREGGFERDLRGVCGISSREWPCR